MGRSFLHMASRDVPYVQKRDLSVDPDHSELFYVTLKLGREDPSRS